MGGITFSWLFFTFIPGVVGLASLIAVPVLLYGKVEASLKRSGLVGLLLMALSSLPMVWTMRTVERDWRGIVFALNYLHLVVQPFGLIGLALLVTVSLVWVERGERRASH